MGPVDPLKFAALLWPDVRFALYQRDIIYSVENNDETYVPAGNMLGKDYVAGFIALSCFLRNKVCRVVTTSVKDDHLRVLWGEIGRLIETARYPLDLERGGPLVINHHDIGKVVNGRRCPVSYLRGMVSKSGEGMSGHHAPYTLLIVDEASGVDEKVYDAGQGWMKRLLVIGNPYPCANFFYRGVKGGDLKASGNGRYHRKVIKVRAEDSPNVQSRRPLLPGVLQYEDGIRGYVYRRKYWDAIRQCIGLDAEFYEGAEVLLFPPDWLNEAERVAASLNPARRAKTVGVDSGEGGANTAWAAMDELGLIGLMSYKTGDTSDIPGDTLAFARKYGVADEDIYFDAGGGGLQHAQRLRRDGHKVKTVAFGEAVTPAKRRTVPTLEQRSHEGEERYAWKNRRAQMYGLLSLKLDMTENPKGFGLPALLVNRPRADGGPSLRRQLAPIPKRYDGEGRLFLPPKNRKDPNSTEKTLMELLGCSPDEADAVVLACYGLGTAARRYTYTAKVMIGGER